MPGSLNRVSAGGSNVWGVNGKQDIYQYHNGGWIQIAGKLVEVSCSADGTVYGVNSADQIFQYNGQGGWSVVAGALTHIAVANINLIWGVNRGGVIYYCDSSHQWHEVGVPIFYYPLYSVQIIDHLFKLDVDTIISWSICLG